MSVWSGIAAAGVAIALALAVFGQPTWEWRLDTTQAREVWQYGVFSVHHELTNKTSGQTVTQDYSYADLAASQPHMAQVFGEFASILYATFAIVFTLPGAATADLPTLGSGIPEFRGQTYNPSNGTLLAWTPLTGWVLAIVSGLALAWASSDVWHLAPVKKAAPARAPKLTPVMKAVEVPLAPPPPPPTEFVVEVPPEPMIEEVFLIGQNGLLIKHMSRSLMSDKDRDVVGSMISAISSFVREAFSERD